MNKDYFGWFWGGRLLACLNRGLGSWEGGNTHGIFIAECEFKPKGFINVKRVGVKNLEIYEPLFETLCGN